jgi:PHD/YefM family antitoxin component YafN of YafNO toxin-antitoxin module
LALTSGHEAQRPKPSKLAARVSGQRERVYVTVHGKPSAVLL